MKESLLSFIKESNHIEGLDRIDPSSQYDAYRNFIYAPQITIQILETFVHTIQPDAMLRDKEGLDVRVGNHFPPPGGAQIREDLINLLERVDDFDKALSPTKMLYEIHVEYETLHPFTDGNGRSGRAIWLWMTVHAGQAVPESFLHLFYYQALSASRS